VRKLKKENAKKEYILSNSVNTFLGKKKHLPFLSPVEKWTCQKQLMPKLP